MGVIITRRRRRRRWWWLGYIMEYDYNDVSFLSWAVVITMASRRDQARLNFSALLLFVF
jgi:hypothetical protein